MENIEGRIFLHLDFEQRILPFLVPFLLFESKLKCMYAFIYNALIIFENIEKKNYYFTTINKFIITRIDYGRVISI